MKRKIVLAILLATVLTSLSGCKNPLDAVFKKKEKSKEEMTFDANKSNEENHEENAENGLSLQEAEKARIDFISPKQQCYLEVPSDIVSNIVYPERDSEETLVKSEEMPWIPKDMLDGAIIGPENQRVFIGIGSKIDIDSIKIAAEKFVSSKEGEALGLKDKTIKTENLTSNESETAFYDELTGLDKTPALAVKKTKVLKVIDGATVIASLGAYYETEHLYVFAMPLDPIENSEAWNGAIAMPGIYQAINYLGDVVGETATSQEPEDTVDESDTMDLGDKTSENGLNEPDKRLKHIEKYPSLHEFKYDGKTIKMANDKLIEFDRKKTSEGFNKPVSESTSSSTDTGSNETQGDNSSGGVLGNPFDKGSNNGTSESEEETVFSGATETIKDGKLNVNFSTPSAGGSVMAGKKGNKIIFKLSNSATVEAQIASKSKLDSEGNNYKFVSKNDGYSIVKKYKSKETLNISGRTMEFYEVEIKDANREETLKRVSVGAYPLVDGNSPRYLILTIKNTGVEDLVEINTWKDCLANIASSGFKVE